MILSKNIFKPKSNANPISPNIFCADPGTIVYKNRLYVYGTNDQQQFYETKQNTYEFITSIVCFSTDDMVNWTFHGEIDVKKIAPWCFNSWAPDVCLKKHKDGSEKFYMYFSNNGCGVGVLCADSPLGPWTDPLGHALVEMNMPELEGCPNPFDPGVCIDDNGCGWLCFGGGIAPGGDDSQPGSVRLVRLADDMISFDGDFITLPAPYFLESSKISYLNGTYIYTYNTSWVERSDWKLEGIPKPSQCSMAYLCSKTPEISGSWKYKNHFFMNPGDMGLNYSNNHVSLVKFHDEWYIFYHALLLQENMPVSGGFRSICVDKLNFDEDTLTISLSQGTRKGVNSIKPLNPFEIIYGSTMFTSADIEFEKAHSASENPSVKAAADGAWFMVKNVDFEKKPSYVQLNLKGKGFVEFRTGKLSSEASAIIKINSQNYQKVEVPLLNNLEKIEDVFFVFSNEGICLKSWTVK